MTHNSNQLVPVPATVLARRIDEEQAKVLRRKPVNSLDGYVRSIIKEEDWTIREQPCLTLPRELNEYISLALRDEGNALIEETRAINNRYVGRSIGSVRMTLVSDIEVLELANRVLDWIERAMKEVLYRNRRRIMEEPDLVYVKLFQSFVTPIDTGIAHGTDRLYQLAWTRAIDCMCYLLLEGCFLTPRHIIYAHSADANHRPEPRGTILRNHRVDLLLDEHMNLFGVETAIYVKTVILEPLARALGGTEPRRTSEELRREFHSCLGNMLEAFPYLCSSSRNNRYIFSVPGTTCVGAFRFLALDGFGAFVFSDSEEALSHGLATNFFRAALDISFEGTVGCSMHPWLTVERMLGEDDALRVTCWLFRQVHSRIVEDYLKINTYFMDPESVAPTAETLVVGDDSQEASGAGRAEALGEELAVFAGWAREAQDVPEPEPDVGADIPKEDADPVLPQIRRSRFFKVLRACGVEIEQGKGSEIKLLRGGAHPFRLGNHYGPNPTVPTFLAAQILKRLEITGDEWSAALTACKA